jgi:hypothetical protein
MRSERTFSKCAAWSYSVQEGPVQREFETDLLPTLGTTPLHHGQVRSPAPRVLSCLHSVLFSNCCGTIVRRLIVRVKDLESISV